MASTRPDPTPEEVNRAFLRAVIAKLPGPICEAMLRDPAVLTELGFPIGEFIEIWHARFHRADLLACVQALANGRPASLVSADGKTKAETLLLDEAGAAVLHVGKEGVRFPHATLFSASHKDRTAALDGIMASGEMPARREAQWRAAIAQGPLDGPLFLALETEIGSSPEAIFREMVDAIETGKAVINDLVPLEHAHYAALLGLEQLPPTLAAFKAAWLEEAAQLGPVRLLRQLKLNASLSILRDDMVAQASDHLPIATRLDLVQTLAASPDPFSVLAALEIACRHRAEPGMDSIVAALTPRMFDRTDPLVAIAGPALETTVAITTALTARSRTFEGWPLYARRLARIVHACQLLDLFRIARVDPAAFEEDVARGFAPQARLANLCDLWEAPVWQSDHFIAPLVHAILMARAAASIGKLDEADAPPDWLANAEAALGSDAEAGWGLFIYAPAPLDEFEADWSGPTELFPDNGAAVHLSFAPDASVEKAIGELLTLSVAFEMQADRRGELAALFPAFLKALDDRNFLVASEMILQLAARWRDVTLSDRVIDMVIGRAGEGRLTDSGAAPRLAMLAAAVVSERVAWLERASTILQRIAAVQRAGPGTISLLRALELLEDFDPALGAKIQPAKSFAMLAYDHLPPIAPGTDNDLAEPGDEPDVHGTSEPA